MSAQVIQAVRGMNDILPDQSHAWEFFEDTVRDWLAIYLEHPREHASQLERAARGEL